MIIGRQDELDRLAALVRGARAGAGGVVLVRGEAGIGKSALLAAAVAAAPPHLRVLRCRGLEADTAVPFLALTELLTPVADAVEELEPFRAAVLRGALGLGPPAPADPLAIWSACLGVLDVASATTPLVVVIDDAHWVDGP